MGTFVGHAIPGTVFILLSLWWTAYIKRNKRLTTGPCESYIKLAVVIIPVVIQVIIDVSLQGTVRMDNAQHLTMGGFLALQSLFELLLLYNAPVPPDLDYAGMVLALLVEWLLFANHLHGRTPLDVLIHTLLIYAIVACVVFVALEAAWKDHDLLRMMRCFCFMLQGTWFYQIGFILYPPLDGMTPWKAHDHEQLMEVVLIFVCHCAVDLLIVLLLSILVDVAGSKSKASGSTNVVYSPLPQKIY